MPNQPLINTRVNITAKDINNNNVAKQFNSVTAIVLDYNEGTINILDKTGSFYFPLSPVTTFTCTIVAGVNGATSFTIS